MLVHNKGNHVHVYRGAVIAPGMNDVPNRLWDKFQANPVNQLLIEDGVLVPSATDEGEQISLSEMNQGEVISKVKDTFSASLLDSFEQEEKDGKNRKGVLSAITEQRKYIENELKSNEEA